MSRYFKFSKLKEENFQREHIWGGVGLVVVVVVLWNKSFGLWPLIKNNSYDTIKTSLSSKHILKGGHKFFIIIGGSLKLLHFDHLFQP